MMAEAERDTCPAVGAVYDADSGNVEPGARESETTVRDCAQLQHTWFEITVAKREQPVST